MANWLLTGGAGFIGQHLAESVLRLHPDDHVLLLDIKEPGHVSWLQLLRPHLDTDRLKLRTADVRDLKQLKENAGKPDVLVNLAAIHREPGHRAEEYFETNVKGAENVCQLALETECRELIFTSSISVYGVHDRRVDERSVVQPSTAYGQSKHQAEQIHCAWAAQTGGHLSVIRPGVVFGQGEKGNVSRLVSESLKRARPIYLQPDQAKAGIYIEELLSLMHWLRTYPIAPNGVQLVNGVAAEHLTFNSFGQQLARLQHFKKQPLTIPVPVLQLATFFLQPLSYVLPANSRFHPARLAKLTVANDVHSVALSETGYSHQWPLGRALADWLEKGL